VGLTGGWRVSRGCPRSFALGCSRCQRRAPGATATTSGGDPDPWRSTSPSISREHVELLRGLVAPFLGAGCDLAIDSEVVARGPESVEPSPGSSVLHVQRLTEMAVQQHEYLCAELRRMRDEFEAEFAAERTLLRVLRQRWMERVCDDKVRGEDALRYLFEAGYAVATKGDPSPASPASGP